MFIMNNRNGFCLLKKYTNMKLMNDNSLLTMKSCKRKIKLYMMIALKDGLTVCNIKLFSHYRKWK